MIADIAAFYENIDLARLMSEVKGLGFPIAEADLLSRALNRWAITGKGLPQGYVPSDVLAKLYMDSIDRALKNKGYDHYRYVDDIRIFCNSEQEAKQAIVDLAGLLRDKGLCLQSSKTQICNKEEAVKEIEAVQPILMGLIRKLRKDPVELILSGPSTEGIQLPKESPSTDVDKVHIQIIQEAFKTFFVEAQFKFDKTLFHFLLNRFCKEQDDYAVNYCPFTLLAHPEETKTVLKYLTEIEEITSLKIVEEFLCSADALYEYQNYLLIEWLVRQKIISSPQLLAKVRQIAKLFRKSAFG